MKINEIYASLRQSMLSPQLFAPQKSRRRLKALRIIQRLAPGEAIPHAPPPTARRRLPSFFQVHLRRICSRRCCVAPRAT